MTAYSRAQDGAPVQYGEFDLIVAPLAVGDNLASGHNIVEAAGLRELNELDGLNLLSGWVKSME